MKEHHSHSIALGILLLFATSYYFIKPKHIDPTINPKPFINETDIDTAEEQQEKNDIQNNNSNNYSVAISKLYNLDGYWDPIDAEFDWCEYNYRWSQFIAEPLNVVTSFLMCIYFIWFYIHYKKYILMLNDILICAHIGIAIGLGSVLFHGTLRYSMQLLDELPMYYAATYCVFLYYFRDTNNNKRNEYKNISFQLLIIQDITLTILLIMTEKENNIYHSIGRGIWTILFGISLFSMYYLVIDTSKESNTFKYGERAFLWFFFAALCWFLDNFFCDYLQTLPFNIPYLHLHAFGWHLGVTMAVHYWLFALILHKMIVIYKYNHNQLQFSSLFGCGIISYVDIKHFHQNKLQKNQKLH